MKQIAPLLLAAFVAATPVAAQDEGENRELREGAEMMSEAFRLLLDGFSKEMEPIAEEWRDFMESLDDLRNYEAPERLPNGDIIIRRSPDAPEYVPEAEGTEL
ncbi:MAG: AAA+ family ATPase [Pseudomonadota bacterium]|nr:AAA+ family ATPase [Pseudomonadota bacterium]